MYLQLPANQAAHNRFRPDGHPEGRHAGDDHGWASGDEVKAAAAGTVLSAYLAGGYNGGWGNRVRIEHAPGVVTTYNHLATGTIPVRAGQRVDAGTFLGRMGETGETRGKHLHFELYVNGSRVDPAPYYSQHLPGTAPAAPAATGDPSQYVDLPNWWYSYPSAADAHAGRYRAGVGIGPGRFRVRGNEGGALLVETAHGNVWLHPKAGAHLTGPAAPAAPAAQHVELPNWWYSYPSAADAHAGRYRAGVGIGPGRFRVLANDRGALQVAAHSGNVWLHPKAGAHVR